MTTSLATTAKTDANKALDTIKQHKTPLMGGGAGAVLGFLVGGPIGAAVGAAAGFFGVRKYSGPHGLTPERKKIYDEAMKTLPDPIKLRKLAEAFEKEGLTNEAKQLRLRALARELPPETKAERQREFRRAIKSEDINHVLAAAQAFESQGYTGNATQLRNRAKALKAAGKA